MSGRHEVLVRLDAGEPLLIEADVSAELAARGYQPHGPLRDAAAAREAATLLLDVHRDAAAAGADVLIAQTERTTVRALARGGLGMRAAALTHRAVELAQEAAATVSRPIAIAGALGPLEELASASPSGRAMSDEHREHVLRLEAAGCDLVLVQAMPTVRESVAAIAVARRQFEDVWATVIVDEEPMRTTETASILIAAGARVVLLRTSGGFTAGATLDRLRATEPGVQLGLSMAVDDPVLLATWVASGLHHGARVFAAMGMASHSALSTLANVLRARNAA